MSIFFAIVYAIFYSSTIYKILTTHHTVSTFSFAGFAITNLGLGISNGFVLGSIGYFTATVMGLITVACNIYITKRLKDKTITTNNL